MPSLHTWEPEFDTRIYTKTRHRGEHLLAGDGSMGKSLRFTDCWVLVQGEWAIRQIKKVNDIEEKWFTVFSCHHIHSSHARGYTKTYTHEHTHTYSHRNMSATWAYRQNEFSCIFTTKRFLKRHKINVVMAYIFLTEPCPQCLYHIIFFSF